MSKKHVERDYIFNILNDRRWTLNTNIFYKNVFSGSDQLKIICSCGRPQTLGVKSLKKYVCSYCKNTYKKADFKDFKVCPICEKPHHLKTKCCKNCNETIKNMGVSIGKALILKKQYNNENILDLIKRKPYLLNIKVDHKEVLNKRKEIIENYNDTNYKRTPYEKYNGDIPQYIKETLKKHKTIELLTISGDKSNPIIHYICKRCNEEQAQSFKNIQKNKGHQCTATKSSGQALVEEFLKNKIKYKSEFETLKCINPITKRQLPYDIEIMDKKILIEIQGGQHITFTPYFHGTIENFEYQKRKDNYKKRWAENKGYKLLYLYYDDFKDDKYKKKIIYAIKQA